MDVAESLPSQLSLAQAQAQRQSTSIDGMPMGGKVTLPPLPPGVIPRKRAASASGVMLYATLISSCYVSIIHDVYVVHRIYNADDLQTQSTSKNLCMP